jgi:hypothetical protein
MADAAELKEAEERGLRRGIRIGRFEGVTFQPFAGIGTWLPEARFVFFRTWFLSLVTYQRRLLANLREVQRVRWMLEHEPNQIPPDARHAAATLPRLEEQYESAVWEARSAAEEFLDEGCGRECVVAAMRATPQRPDSVIEYDDLAQFVEEDERRGKIYPTHVAIRPDAVFGIDWRLENPFRRWEMTTWTIGWLCGPFKEMREALEDEPYAEEEERAANATHEVYAIESLDPSNPWAEDGRVWLLGTVRRRAAVEEALREMSLQAMRDRNSLVAAADAVAAAQHHEAAGDPPTRRRL